MCPESTWQVSSLGRGCKSILGIFGTYCVFPAPFFKSDPRFQPIAATLSQGYIPDGASESSAPQSQHEMNGLGNRSAQGNPNSYATTDFLVV